MENNSYLENNYGSIHRVWIVIPIVNPYMPSKKDIDKEIADFKISIEDKLPSEDETLEHWLLIAEAIKKIEAEKDPLSAAGSE